MELTTKSTTVDGRHHIKTKRSLYIRAFLKLYDANPETLDTCKLFWGTMFAPLAVLVILFLTPIAWVSEQIDQRFIIPRRHARWAREDAERTARYSDWENIVEEEPSGPSRREQMLSKVANFMGAAWFKVSAGIARALPFLGVVLALAIIAFFVYAVIVWTTVVLQCLLAVLVIAASSAVGTGIIMLMVFAYNKYREHHPKRPRIKREHSTLRQAFESVHNHTCAKIDIED
jgi:hypothetical protein